MCLYLTYQAVDCLLLFFLWFLLTPWFWFWFCPDCLVCTLHELSCFWITTLPTNLDLFACVSLTYSLCICICTCLPVVMHTVVAWWTCRFNNNKNPHPLYRFLMKKKKFLVDIESVFKHNALHATEFCHLQHCTHWLNCDMAHSHGHNYNYKDTEVWTLVVLEVFVFLPLTQHQFVKFNMKTATPW